MAKREPICTPSAPRASAAAIWAPVAMPPAAMTGMSTAATHSGTSTMVVISSRPLCPPASKPSQTTASQPASSHLTARAGLATTCTTVQPASFRGPTTFLGEPAEVKKIFTPSSRAISTHSRAVRVKQGNVHPEGLARSGRGPCGSGRGTGPGRMLPAPIRPRPPAFGHRGGQLGAAVVDHAALDDGMLDAEQIADPVVSARRLVIMGSICQKLIGPHDSPTRGFMQQCRLSSLGDYEYPGAGLYTMVGRPFQQRRSRCHAHSAVDLYSPSDSILPSGPVLLLAGCHEHRPTVIIERGQLLLIPALCSQVDHHREAKFQFMLDSYGQDRLPCTP